MARIAPTTSQKISDETLAVAASRGCRSSFEQLAIRHQVPLVHFLRRWSTNEEAEDLAQETFFQAWCYLHRFQPAWKFRTWLYTIARRLSINATRKRRPVTNADVGLIADPSSEPGDKIAQADSRQRLWKVAAEVLDERALTALWLYYAEDMPIVEIARVVGRTPSAVKTMLFRARKRLSESLDGEREYANKNREPRGG